MKELHERVTLVGFGLMGAQIAQVFAQNGINVLAFDVDDKSLAKGLSLIKSGRYGLEAGEKKGRITHEEASAALARVSITDSLDRALSGAEFVLEVAIEDLSAKRKIFQEAASKSSPNSILASNTSTLSISKIGEGLSSPEARERLAGMHFFNPPQLMKLVEVVKTRDTREDIVYSIRAVAERLGKTPVTVVDYPGFIANRIGISVFAEASDLLAKGVANVRDIDLSMRLGYGYPMGPFELGDLVGLEARLRNMEALFAETGEEKFRPPEILRRLVSEGYLGDPKTKPGSKGGYYEYFRLARPSSQGAS